MKIGAPSKKVSKKNRNNNRKKNKRNSRRMTPKEKKTGIRLNSLPKEMKVLKVSSFFPTLLLYYLCREGASLRNPYIGPKYNTK